VPQCRTTTDGGAVTRARRFRLPGPHNRDGVHSATETPHGVSKARHGVSNQPGIRECFT